MKTQIYARGREMTTPDNPPATDEILKAAWRAAITLANNVCVEVSNYHNAHDDTTRADAANECSKHVRAYIEPDEQYMAEMRAMLAERNRRGE